MNRLVLDGSAALNLCFQESKIIADSLFDFFIEGEALVPALWKLEIINALLSAERAARITRSESAHYWTLLSTLPIKLAPESSFQESSELHNLARETGLTAYDAAYLSLSLKEGMPLASGDKQLRQAAWKCGVDLVPPALKLKA